MTVLRGFVITIASGIAFGVIGGAVGYSLGRFAPDYYRIVFRMPREIDLNPVQAGVGLGITQGLIAGLLIGLIIVVAVSWYNSRITNHST